MLKSFAGGRIFGVRYGQAPPQVVALHGWGRTNRDFQTVLEGFDAVALDLPGFGATPAPDYAWGSEEYANAVWEVLREFPSPAVLVGHSFGGRVAVQVASQHPETVKALVLTGVPLLRPRGQRKRRVLFRFRVARAFNKAGIISSSRMEAMRRKYGSSDYRNASGVMRDVLVRTISETYEPQLSTILCPVELVWHEDDDEVPIAVAEIAMTMLKTSTLTRCAGRGHLIPLSAPDTLRGIIRECLK